MNKRDVRERGAAYLLVMIALAVGTILASGFLLAQRTATAVAANFPAHTSARGIAESGLALTLNYLQTSDTWRTDKSPGTWVTNQALSGGTFSVTVTDATNDFNDNNSEPVNVAVTGTVNGVSHRVYALVTGNATEAVNNTLLLVVNSTSGYDVYDQRKIDLFEGWGYTVTLAAHGESQADLAAAAEAAAVVYISESVTSGTVNTKLRDVTVGIVCDEPWLVDEFGLATSGTSNGSGTQFNILNNTHPVTTGLPTGSVTVANSSQSFARYTGVASGVTTLAQGPGGNAAILVADAGAALTSGTAAGRRVFYPGRDNWDLNNTNAVIDIILRQALEWASGGTGVTKTWATTFDADPTASDPNGDGTNDFSMRFGGSPGGVSGGMWADSGTSATTPMDTAPNCDFDRPTRMSARMRATSVGGRGASIMINFDYDGSLFSPVIANLILQADNTQTLELYGKNGSGEQLLHTVTGLDNGFHDIQLDLDPDSDQVRLTINGSIEGWFDYYTRTYNGTEDLQRFATLLGWSADAEFDNFTVIYNNETSANNDVQALVVYEFNQPPPITPTLVSHWTLDDNAGGGSTPPGDASTFGVSVANQISLSGGSIINSYDSTVGTYSATNGSNAIVTTNGTSSGRISGSGQVRGDAYSGVGSTPSSVITASTTGSKNALTVNKGMGDVPAPTGMPSSSGNRTVSSGSSTTISSDVTYNNFSISSAGRVNISGDVRILVTGDFILTDASEIRLNTGATLKLYVQGKFEVKNGSEFNNDTRRAGDAEIYLLGNSDPLDIDDGSELAAIISSKADIQIKNGSRVYGLVRSQGSISMQDGSDIHMDRGIFGLTTVTALDSTGVSSGSLNDNPTSGAGGFGDGGTAFQFDGSNDFVEVPHDPAYLLDAGALSFWFRADNTSGRQGLVSKDSQDYDDGGHLDIQLNGSTLQARLQSTSNSYTLTRSSVSSNNWHHVLVAWGPNGYQLYFNGTLADSDAYTGGLGTSSGGTGNANPWTFGVGQQYSSDNSSNNWDAPFDGRLDDIRLYAHQLVQSQATNLATGNAPGDTVDYTVYDTSGFGTPYDLAPETPANVAWTSDGLRIDTGTVLTNTLAATKIRNALISSGQFTFLFRITPESVSDPSDRDLFAFEGATSTNWVEIEQEGQDTTAKMTNSAGTLNETRTGTITATETEILYSFDGTTLMQYVNGSLVDSWSHPGDLNAMPADIRLFLARDGTDGSSEFFLGTYHRFAIYDTAFDPINAQRSFNGQDPNYEVGEMGYQATWIETQAP